MCGCAVGYTCGTEAIVLSKVVQISDGLSVAVPADVAERYHLAPDVEVEVTPTDDGILMKPIGVGPWFSVEWERALDAVLEWHRSALEMAGE